MGKAGRFACILTPMILTVASLITVALLLAGGTRRSILPSFYYVRLDMRNLNVTEITQRNTTAKDLGLEDFYVSYLWNYCSGSIDDKANLWKIDRCSDTTSGFSFDIEQIVQKEANKSITFPEPVQKVQKAVNIVTKFMNACYVLGAIATAVTFLIGWFGLLSRWGSCVTTIFADLSFCFLFVASLCSSVLAYSLRGAYTKAFDAFGVEAVVGRRFITTTWVATIFSLGAAIFWMMSMCCCSGRKKKIMEDQPGPTMVQHTGSGGYHRVSDPYGGASTTPLPYGAPKPAPGYEPMRHN
ncbi:SUR7/PalI family-domain-containing protein [Pyronema omphalodes]|nr:SUR7/PalI family-domain-containing protein [Pyronema omphalodes]